MGRPVLVTQLFICQLIWWLGGSYGGFDLCFYFSMIHLSACNMGWGEGGSHCCGRPVMLSLNVLMFCLYYGLEWGSYIWRWPVLRYLHDLLVKWSTLMAVWSKALPKTALNAGRGKLESCQWLGVRQCFQLDTTVYATCRSWQNSCNILRKGEDNWNSKFICQLSL